MGKKKPAKKPAKTRAKATSPLTVRERQKLLMRKIRYSEQGIAIRDCLDPKKRARLEKDVYKWLAFFFPHKFSNPFTKFHHIMIDSILHRARHGGDKAVAAPRGGGKTSIVEAVVIFCVLTGRLIFPVVVGATKDAGLEILTSIKHEFEHNEVLAAFYPEVCDPIVALEGESRRAKKQNYCGELTNIMWGKYMIVLPTIEGSRASGSVIAARGLNSRIRGTKHITLRPDFCLIDDPETDDSARNPKQVTKRKQKLDREIAGLVGPGKTIARVALVTIQLADCLADLITNPKLSPTWDGMRIPLLESMPERDDLVQEYVRLFKECIGKGDEDGREALRFYVLNRADIEQGAKASDPSRYITKAGKDGKPLEISPIQHALNWIARIGWDNFRSEFQNDPPAESKPETLGITAELVATRQNNYVQNQFPRDTYFLASKLDLGKSRCHSTSIAWIPGQSGLVIDYYSFDVLGLEKTVKHAHHDDAVERAIYNAMVHWRSELLAEPYHDTRGECRPIDLAVIDAGDWSEVVYRFIRDVGGLPFIASKGFGDGRGTAPWSPGKASKTRIVGNHWWISYLEEYGIWLYGFDADYWKQQVHQRFLTPTLNADQTIRDLSLSLFQQDRLHQHLPYGNEITAEELRNTFVTDDGWKRKWFKIRKQNHRLDNAANGCMIHDVWLTRMAGQVQREESKDSEPQPQSQADEPRAVLRTPSGLPYLISERKV